MRLALAVLIALYLAYAVVMVVLHPRFIYPFLPDNAVLPEFERIRLDSEDGTPIFVQERAGAGPVVLYFMGNAGAVPLFEVAFNGHIAAGRHVIVMEYRGGGGRPGVPSEARLKSDALIVADYALGKGKPLIVQGYSLGTGLATHVSARRPAERVVLTAPYDGLCRIMASRAWLPACFLPFVQRWNSLRDTEAITVPILVLHGTEDSLIPPRYSAAFEGLPTVSRKLVEGAGHADLSLFPAYLSAIEEFLSPLDP